MPGVTHAVVVQTHLRSLPWLQGPLSVDRFSNDIEKIGNKCQSQAHIGSGIDHLFSFS